MCGHHDWPDKNGDAGGSEDLAKVVVECGLAIGRAGVKTALVVADSAWLSERMRGGSAKGGPCSWGYEATEQ